MKDKESGRNLDQAGIMSLYPNEADVLLSDLNAEIHEIRPTSMYVICIVSDDSVLKPCCSISTSGLCSDVQSYYLKC